MAKAAAKKSVPKKGKYFLICSLATWPLGMKASGPWRHTLRQAMHGFGLSGRRGASLAEVVEIQRHFPKCLWKKSGPMISSWVREREFKKLNLSINKNQLDVDDLTDFILSLQPQPRRSPRRSPRRLPQRRPHQRRLWRRLHQRRRSPRRQRRHERLFEYYDYITFKH